MISSAAPWVPSLDSLMIPSSLSKEEIERFSRQIMMSEFGVTGQERLSKASVLIVGAGGLGSPSSLYLAAAGVGKLGIVDYDTVEIDNLHRQIIHREDRLGMTKVESAKNTLEQYINVLFFKVNPDLLFLLLLPRINSNYVENAVKIIGEYDMVLDASDNAVTRYLVNDVCVLLGKPLVSGAALRFDGQLTTYAFNGSACYRCVYPVPPPVSAVVNCQFAGVLGPITGTIGSLQALEAIRIITADYAGKMLKFDGLTGTFRSLRLRNRNPDCAVCGDHPTIHLNSLLDYERFCGSKADDKCQVFTILSPEERISCTEYVQSKEKYTVVDVRPPGHFDIVRLPNAINIPIDQCAKQIDQVCRLGREKELLVVCRAGLDSQIAVRLFKENGIVNVKDMVGGMNAYAATVDPSLPRY